MGRFNVYGLKFKVPEDWMLNVGYFAFLLDLSNYLYTFE
jgi:hypothetical protein